MSKNMNDKQYENVARQLKTCEDCKIENVKEINAIFGQSRDKLYRQICQKSLAN